MTGLLHDWSTVEAHHHLQTKDHLTFFLNLSLVSGNVAPYRVGGHSAYLVNCPAHAEQVLVQREAHYVHPPHPYRDLLPFLTTDGELLLRLTSASPDNLERFGTIVVRHAAALVAAWQEAAASHTPLALTRPLKERMLHGIIELLFGLSTCEGVADFVAASSFIEEVVANQIAFSPDTSLEPEARRHYHEAQASQRRLATTIAAPMQPDGPSASLQNAIVRTLLNGYNALAGGLAWTLLLLAQHPPVATQVRAEVAALGKRALTSADLPRLALVRRVLKEALRLYPPAWMLGRMALTEDRLGECPIPAGAMVSVSPWLLHRQEQSWEEPERFDPERFQPQVARARPRFAYFPFGGGSRICPAAPLSLPLLQLTLATLVQTFAFELPPDAIPIPRGLISLRPTPDVQLRLRLA